MARVKRFFTDPRTLIGIGVLALAIFVLLVADSWRTAALLIESLIIVGLLVWGTAAYVFREVIFFVLEH